ncbi:NMT1/THI5 like domain-containing protein [Neobacillus bataviensis LMG 21833]|uniref:NMT1/THI5 like domain-containing protein n=1 Tax=Neobacillus bataviensis LMG 21833 TaxID=1117379 RepID=K6EBJ8_9BACI|nr:ABC transporter substrate-binding protein [Neobacillus bataviensis]EKN70806.1 NMT1/THI5 like domain-containing protein [Neobacillus bataviensis LMG 21833]
MKKSLLTIMVCLLLLLVSACGKGGADKASGGQQKVSIMLDWYPNAVHSFLYAAIEKGYFKEQGLDVDIQMPADTNDPLRLVAAGKVDLAISYQPEVLVARSENIPVQSIAAIVRHPLNQLMVAADSPIRSPKDLAGKTIGYPTIPLDEAIIQTMVKSDGGDTQNVKMVDVGWDLIPAIATKKTDALMGGFINHEKLLLEKEGYPIRTLNPKDYGVPDYYELVLVGSEKGLKEKPEVFKKFIAATSKGQTYVADHPEEGLSILLKHEDKTSPLETDIERKSLEILLPLMDAKEKPFGYQDPETWEKVTKWLKTTKMIKKEVNAEDAFINF